MEEKVKMTKHINVFDQTHRQIRCIRKAHDYLGDGTLIIEEELEVGQLYTFVRGTWESYGSMVFLKEVPNRMGFQAYLFEELEEQDEEELIARYRDELFKSLEKSEAEYEQGNYIENEEFMKELDELIEKVDEESMRQRDVKRIRPFLDHIAEVWEKYPDLRFGQLISNATCGEMDIFFMEEDQMLKAIDNFDDQVRRNQAEHENMVNSPLYGRGHDAGDAYWIVPVDVHLSTKITDQDVKELEGEIFVLGKFFRENLRDVFVAHLDMELAQNRYHYTYAFSDEGCYITRFEDCLEYNFYTQDAMRDIVSVLKKDSKTREFSGLLEEMLEHAPALSLISVMGP